ncbi:127R [Yaba monkey tumor virus]|uniref:127R n=1 Tax=Yaba monkey tumor virus (strain VR587) TaxID=928314 RepID=Q6TUP2_YMTV5|nr:hypothetical protein YMTVg127R [Yaba monkey tumor virus]AAR07484.1 127R [Yaba monkey tumor virus]
MSFTKIIPFFNFSDIKTYVHYLANNGKKDYYGPLHAKKITLEIKKYIDDEITVNNLISIHVYKLKTKKNDCINNNFIISKAIVCVQQAKRGGYIIINELNTSKRFKLKDDKIIILSPLSRYHVSKVFRGRLVIIVLEMFIPSMQILLINNKNVKFTNNIKLFYPVKGDQIFIIKQITNVLNKVVCTQVLINQNWYSVVNAGCSKLLLPSICFGRSISVNCDNVDVKSVINNIGIIFNSVPFNYILPQKIIYNNFEFSEKVLYCKLC